MKQCIAMTCMLALMTAVAMPAQSKGMAGVVSKVRKVKPPKIPSTTGYGESRKERDQRLQRECQGKPNAGACEGYAR